MGVVPFRFIVTGINFLTHTKSYAKEIVFPNRHFSADVFIGGGTGYNVWVVW